MCLNYLGKLNIAHQKIAIKQRYLDYLETKQMDKSTPTKPNELEIEISGFCQCIASHLKTMPNKKRLTTQSKIMSLLCAEMDDD